MKFSSLILTVSMLFASILHLTCQPAENATPPNIILLMGDDHGWEETGYNGHPHVLTPVLDEMAAAGLRLDRFYAAHPNCSPTRGSILTGRHPNRYGTFTPNFSIRPEEITIAHLLGEAGYVSGHFGKWHVGPVKADSPTSPGAMGFDEWLSHDNFFELNPPLSRNGADPEVFEGESSAVVVDEAKQFIRKAKAQNHPFLAVVWFGSPHEPYSGLPDDLARYDDIPALYADRDSVRLTSNETGNPTRRPLGDVLRERYAEITAMDRAIGDLRVFLDEEGIRDNTLVWYMGDNGTPSSGVLASPLRGWKGDVYDGGTRVPAVIEWPARIPVPKSSSLNTVTSDILPTLAAMASVPVSHNRPIDGINLLPFIDGDMEERPAPIHFWMYRTGNLQQPLRPWVEPALQQGTTPLVKLMNGIPTRNFTNFHHHEIGPADYLGARAIVDSHYKLVIDGNKAGDDILVELFNLRDDPYEEVNIADMQPERVELMQMELRAWQESVLRSLSGADYKQ